MKYNMNDNNNNAGENGFIEWQHVSDMEIEGKYPDLYIVSGWNDKEGRELSDEELDYIQNNYGNAIYEELFFNR